MTIAEFQARWTGHVPKVQDVTREYAVLVPLVECPEGPSLLFEVRAETLDHQPGEVCFPGGGLEPGETPAQCALRETFEELSVPPEEIQLVNPLDLVVHPGRFVMHPFLGVISQAGLAALSPSRAEVQETFLVTAAIYFVLTFTTTRILGMIERRMNRSKSSYPASQTVPKMNMLKEEGKK